MAHTAAQTSSVRVRFAPSPTGKLHVGGARTAIFNWAFARSCGGSFILRIDDTDPTRSTDENAQVILRAMRWLGLNWDEGPSVGGAYGPYTQAERSNIYQQAAQKLLDEGKAYPCFCTQEQLEADRAAAHERKDSYQGYSRRCRDIDPDVARKRIQAGEPYTLRIKVPYERGDVIIEDAVHGKVVFAAGELDDFVIMRSDGTPTYNFATVVDDAAMAITHVIRGDDHLSNTPRQVIVYEALEAPVPVFAHISMILGGDGKKLSKRHGATSVEEYRDAGYLPEAFVNYLALLGWSLDGETTIISPEEICCSFSLDRVSKNPAVFDQAKLDWMNAEYLSHMDERTFISSVLLPGLVDAGLESAEKPTHDDGWYSLLAAILQPRTKHTTDIASLAGFLYAGDTLEYDARSVEKHLAQAHAKSSLVAAIDALSTIDETNWKTERIDETLAPLPETLDISKRKFYGALRVAVCGNQVSPPLGESFELLGKDQTLARLDRAQAYTPEN